MTGLAEDVVDVGGAEGVGGGEGAGAPEPGVDGDTDQGEEEGESEDEEDAERHEQEGRGAGRRERWGSLLTGRERLSSETGARAGYLVLTTLGGA